MRPLQRLSLVALLLPAVLPAQQPSASDITTLHVTKQITILDIVVTDKHGNAVTNLTPDDFKIYENGVLQKITHFEPPRPDLAATLPATAPKDHNGRDDWGSAPLTMLVIDELNTPFTEMAYSRQQVERYLKTLPTLMPQPTMVLWLNDYGFHPLSPFTRDRDSLLTAVSKHSPSLPGKLMRGDAVSLLAESFSALQQIALFSRGDTGAKRIIWVGRGFPGVNIETLDDRDQDILNRAIHSTLDLLLASRVQVDVIDPTDLLGSNPTPTTTIGDTMPILDDSVPTAGPDPFLSTFNFAGFSRQTGGQYFYARNDIDHEIATSASHANSFYTLTYSPSQLVEDGKYRKIDIRMSRPGLTATTKQGYYPGGANPTTAPTQKELSFDLYEASVTGMTYTGVGLNLKHCTRDQDMVHITCILTADTGTLTFQPGDNGVFQTKFITAISSLDAKSKLLYWSAEQSILGVPAAEADRIATGATQFTIHGVVAPQAKAVRFVLRDSSGRIGTVDLPPDQIKPLSASLLALQQLQRQQHHH